MQDLGTVRTRHLHDAGGPPSDQGTVTDVLAGYRGVVTHEVGDAGVVRRGRRHPPSTKARPARARPLRPRRTGGWLVEVRAGELVRRRHLELGTPSHQVSG